MQARTEMTMSKKAKTHELMIGGPRGPAEFKSLGGSDVDEFNQALANEALSSLWTARSDDEQRNRQYLATTDLMVPSRRASLRACC